MSDTAVFDAALDGEWGADQIASTSPEDARRRMIEEELGISEKDVLARVNNGFMKSKKNRLAREITWWLCCAFYLGDHYAEINKDSTAVLTGLETKKDVPDFRVRARNNKITPAADELVGRMVRSMVSLTATPATDDPSDIDRAQAATSVLESEWRRMGLTQSDHELRLWTVLTGSAGLWVRWNDTLGELMGLQDGSFMPSGEIEHQVVPPFHLYPDPQGTRYHNMRYMIHACEADVDMLKSAYPDLAEKIGPDSLRRGSGKYWEDRLKSLMSSSLGVRYEIGYGQYTCTLLTYWEPRSREHPNGIMAICTPTAVLWMGENPWAHFNGGFDWCPIEMFRYRELGISFWGMGAVEIAIPLQRELNRTLSQILENRNECSNPRYWIPKGCRVSTAGWTNAPGERVIYTPTPVELSANGRAYKPEREDPPPIPSALFKLIADLKAEIEDVFAYHQVSKGGAPPGVRSGVAIENLQETDQAPAVPIVQRHNVCWARVGKRLLQLAHDHWDFQRMINVGG
ncbi:MAG TPA: hypothetical protein VM285_02665, partial [Polyangia bacterium]|nr:hypothetical protein [Polyangia bacterium]